MSSLLPHRFLFRYSLTVAHEGKLPRDGKRLLALPESCRLADIASLDGQVPFGDLRLAWNERGLAVSVEVTGKRQPLRCQEMQPDDSDGLQVWIDTRNTQNIHRASRFCHAFSLMPLGGGSDLADSVGRQWEIPRAKELTPIAGPGTIRVSSTVSRDGYLLEAWLSAEALNGYDPEAQPRLGFYYALRDAELGLQTLTVGPEFPYAFDPSLWSTLELSKS
jgi:hypothetical protein